MRKLWGAAATAALITGLGTGLGGIRVAAADAAIDATRAAVERSEYMVARSQLVELLARGTNGPDELAEIYRLTGIVAAALGDEPAATDAFERALALAPKITLAGGTSPKITRPFAAAQAFWSTNAPLKFTTETTATPPAVTITNVSDPLEMVARFKVAVVADGKPEALFERPAADAVTIGLPAARRLDLRVVGLDGHGNRVVEFGSREVPIVIVGRGQAKLDERVGDPPKLAPKPAAHPRPIYLSWWLWGSAAIVVGGVGGYFGTRALAGRDELNELNANSANHSFDEARAIERRTRRDVLVTNIGLGLGGALGVTAAILFLTRPRSTEQHMVITPVPTSDGGAVVVQGAF